MKNLKEFNSELEIRKLKHRFNDDQKLQLSVIDDPYWDYYLELYGGKELWEKVVDGIFEEYGGSIPKFLKDFYDVREKMIQDIRGLVDDNGINIFDVFNQPDQKARPGYEHPHYDINGPFYTVPAEERKGIRKGDVYNEACTGHTFLSLDLIKANVQAMSYFYPNFIVGKQISEGYSVEDMYQDYLDKYLHSQGLSKTITFYISRSKYMRQVVFGNLNADRQTKIEKYLIWNAGKVIGPWLTSLGVSWEYAQLGSDELVLEIMNPVNNIQKFYGPDLLGKKVEELQSHVLIPDDPYSCGISIRAELFDLVSYTFKTSQDHEIRVYKKKFYDGRIDYKKLEKTYRPQIYELLNDLPFDPDEKDMVFNYQKEANAKFMARLHLVNENPTDYSRFLDANGNVILIEDEVSSMTDYMVRTGKVIRLENFPGEDGYLKRLVTFVSGEKEYTVEAKKCTLCKNS